MNNELVVRFLNDGKRAELVQPYWATTADRFMGVPKGFTTDFCSVPAIVAMIPKLGKYTKASVVHDWLYYSGYGDQEYCDKAYRDLMLHDGCSRWRVALIYRGLRMFGSVAYKSHRKAGHSWKDFI